jgi:oligogalacturonide lyase
MFAGDGGGPNDVAAPENGQWIYLFVLELFRVSVAQLPNAQQNDHAGRFKTEKLVNLSKHDYSLEPNVTFLLI